MSTDKRTNLIINDYLTKFEGYSLKSTYAQLYEDLVSDNKISQLFSILHQKLDELLGHMNSKSKTNGHYNAAESRELLEVIDLLDELKQTLKTTKYNFILQKDYESKLKQSATFLEKSGGSPIPEDYQEIALQKYDPIFFFTTTSVTIPARAENIDLKLVGEGAFAIVHKFKDPYYNKIFAKKTLKPSTTELEKERFLKEYTIMSQMNFPYTLEVYRLTDDDNSYIMEYCDSNLENYIATNNTKVGFEIRKRIALQFLYAINYIHFKKLLHRDISTRNILIKQFDSGVVTIKLTDFGLVKEPASDFTKSDTEYKGSIIDPTIDPSVDKFKNYNIKNEIYAIGVVLQFIFTGKKSIAANKVPQNLQSIVVRCTSNDLNSRYDKAADIISDVEQIQSL